MAVKRENLEGEESLAGIVGAIFSASSKELEIWKNRAKTAEAKVDNLEGLLKKKDEALKLFADKFEGVEITSKFVDKISWYDGEKAAEAYYIDKTEGD